MPGRAIRLFASAVHLRKGIGGGKQSCNGFLVPRRRAQLRRGQRWSQQLGDFADDAQLFLLPGGNEAVEARHACHVWECAQPLSKGCSVRGRWRKQLDAIGGGSGVVHELEVGRHRFDAGIAQIERIEIETHVAQQR